MVLSTVYNHVAKNCQLNFLKIIIYFISFKTITSKFIADGRHFSEAYMRQIISKISREELEDKYLRLQEQNVVSR